jgi:hypothetical protein
MVSAQPLPKSCMKINENQIQSHGYPSGNRNGYRPATPLHEEKRVRSLDLTRSKKYFRKLVRSFEILPNLFFGKEKSVLFVDVIRMNHPIRSRHRGH